MKAGKVRSSHLLTMVVVFLVTVVSACGGGGSSSGSGTPWKFAYMSDNKDATDDSGVNLTTVGRIAQDMADQGVSLVLVGGDLIDGRNLDVDGLNEQYGYWVGAMAPVYNASISVYPVPGNHEYWCETAEDCVDAWVQTMVPILPAGTTSNDSYPGREYSFTFNNAFFIGLDQNQFGSSMPDYYRGNDVDWIAARIAVRDATAQPHLITFGHMPQLMLEYGWSDANKENRDEFWSEIGAAGSKMFFTGHSHTYALGLTTTVDGIYSIYQIIAGSAGAGFESGTWDGTYYESDRCTSVDRNNSHEGYALVTINGLNVNMVWRYYDTNDETFKSRTGFSYTLDSR